MPQNDEAASISSSTTVIEDQSETTTTTTTTTSGQFAVVGKELVASIVDDVRPATETNSLSTIEFSDVPLHTECEIGTSLLLPCRTVNPVAECQWSWQPLPPRHLPLPDISDIPTISTSKIIYMTFFSSSYIIILFHIPSYNRCTVYLTNSVSVFTGQPV